MSDLDPGLRGLIDDARDAEAPPDGARERVHGRVMARVTAAAAGAAATTAAATTAKASAGVATWLKLVVGGALVVGAGVAVSVSQDSPPPNAPQAASGLTTAADVTAQAATESAATESAAADEPRVEEEEPEGVGADDEQPEPTASAIEPAARPTSSVAASEEHDPEASPEETTDPLALELTALRTARARLNGGDAAGALATLDAHEAKQLRGALGQERAVVRVLALCQLGRVAEAQHAGALLLRLAPNSPTAKRLRNSCAAPPAP